MERETGIEPATSSLGIFHSMDARSSRQREKGHDTGDFHQSAPLAISCILLQYSEIGSGLWMFSWMRFIEDRLADWRLY